MNRRPTHHSTNGGLVWVLALFLIITVILAFHSAGRAAQWLAGDGWAGPPPNDAETIRTLIADGPIGLWPTINMTVFWVLLGFHVLLVSVILGTIWGLWVRYQAPADDSAHDLSSAHRARPWRHSVESVRRLRPSLTKKQAKDESHHGVLVGVLPKGRLRAPINLRADWESTLLLIMAPRAGKTTRVAIPAVLDAPGAVVATSNKPDLLFQTRQRRSDVGRCWVFDPQELAKEPQRFTWNPLERVHSLADATNLARHFVRRVDDTSQKFWVDSARDLVALLILAARIDQQPLGVISDWLDTDIELGVEALLNNDSPAEARALRKMLAMPAQTLGGIRAQAVTSVSCLRSTAVKNWVAHQDGRDAFDAATFIESNDTLYLMSEEKSGNCGPLLAAFVSEIIDAGLRIAQDRPGGRLDPPLTAVLDEAANICAIEALPSLYSHMGSRGIVPITILQNRAQGISVWGRHGMDQLWSASTVKIIGPGIEDAQLADELSRFIGTHEVTQHSVSRSDGHVSNTATPVEKPMMTAADIREIEKGWCLLFGTGLPPVLCRQLAHYERWPELDNQSA